MNTTPGHVNLAELEALARFTTMLTIELASRPLPAVGERPNFGWFHRRTPIIAPNQAVLNYAQQIAKCPYALLMGLFLVSKLPIGTVRPADCSSLSAAERAFRSVLRLQAVPHRALFLLAQRLGNISAYDNNHPYAKLPFTSDKARQSHLRLERLGLECLDYNLQVDFSSWRVFLQNIMAVAFSSPKLDIQQRKLVIASIARLHQEALRAGVDLSLDTRSVSADEETVNDDLSARFIAAANFHRSSGVQSNCGSPTSTLSSSLPSTPEIFRSPSFSPPIIGPHGPALTNALSAMPRGRINGWEEPLLSFDKILSLAEPLTPPSGEKPIRAANVGGDNVLELRFTISLIDDGFDSVSWHMP